MERKVIEAIASRVDARIRCMADCKREGHEHLAEWVNNHRNHADTIAERKPAKES